LVLFAAVRFVAVFFAAVLRPRVAGFFARELAAFARGRAVRDDAARVDASVLAAPARGFAFRIPTVFPAGSLNIPMVVSGVITEIGISIVAPFAMALSRSFCGSADSM
jgi:hypothetical protein